MVSGLQNQLNDQNATFVQDKAADAMFLNFWWTEEELADQKLLEQSAEKAETMGIDPYQVYAGIDIQANGYNTPIRWDLFESGENSTHTSLGITVRVGPMHRRLH